MGEDWPELHTGFYLMHSTHVKVLFFFFVYDLRLTFSLPRGSQESSHREPKTLALSSLSQPSKSPTVMMDSCGP